MSDFNCIIPARFASSRFPGKPLCDIAGKTMINRVYESVTKWTHWQQVYVATDSKEIVDACEKDNIPCLMTGSHHLDCLDRAAEAVDILESRGDRSDKYIIIQGDEPLFNVETLNVDLTPSIINFYTHVQDKNELYDANAVKVVVSENQRALYFSRYSLPYHDPKTRRSSTIDLVVYKQIGVYVFTGEMLRTYTGLCPSYLENIEGVGLNRLLEKDIDVFMRYTPYDSISVDVPSDRNRILELLEQGKRT